MFEEKPMIEAVAAYFDKCQVFVKTEADDDALFPIKFFSLEELKYGNFRYIVDMPNLPKEVEERIEKYKAEKEKNVETKGKNTKEKTLGEISLELKEQGLQVKEIAAQLGRSAKSVSCAIWNEKKKRERMEASEDQEEVYIPETVKRASIVTGAEVVVDVKKARALRKAGWSMEKTADEFNISVEDMEGILDEKD